MESNSLFRSKTQADRLARPRRTSLRKLSPEALSGLVQVFSTLADESRMQILLALARAGEMHVSALCALLGKQQPAVSHHLTLLRMSRLVGVRREGKHNYYRLESSYLGNLLQQVFADLGNDLQSLHFKDFCLSFKSK